MLEKIVEHASSIPLAVKRFATEEQRFVTACAMNVTTTLMDVATTYRGVSLYGIKLEQNPIGKVLLENYGIGGGLCIGTVLFSVGLLAIAYGMNKTSKDNRGNMLLYMHTVLGSLTAAENARYLF